MKVTEETLLQSGFNYSEIERLKNNVKNFGGTLDEAIQDLARRFNVAKWITIVALLVFIFASIFSTQNNILSLAFSLLVGLPFIWYLTPAKLAFKAWRCRRYYCD
ncbi:hypothetical protein ACFFJN_05120 [Erwinia mallotivora]|uniref:hypothetical protein n=1 Tax=Erwinia mallotivora TaxID=69222 RepID=UPI0035F0ECD9